MTNLHRPLVFPTGEIHRSVRIRQEQLYGRTFTNEECSEARAINKYITLYWLNSISYQRDRMLYLSFENHNTDVEKKQR